MQPARVQQRVRVHNGNGVVKSSRVVLNVTSCQLLRDEPTGQIVRISVGCSRHY